MSEYASEVRELLPAYVRLTLGAAERREVEAHVAACAGCAAELRVLEAAYAVLSRTPAVDVAGIAAAVNALPRPAVRALPADVRALRPVLQRARWRASRSRFALAVAAAAVILAVGAGGLRLAGGLAGSRDEPAGLAVAAVELPEPAAGVTFGGNLAGLADSDIEALLQELDDVQGVLPADPDPGFRALGSAAGEGAL